MQYCSVWIYRFIGRITTRLKVLLFYSPIKFSIFFSFENDRKHQLYMCVEFYNAELQILELSALIFKYCTLCFCNMTFFTSTPPPCCRLLNLLSYTEQVLAFRCAISGVLICVPRVSMRLHQCITLGLFRTGPSWKNEVEFTMIIDCDARVFTIQCKQAGESWELRWTGIPEKVRIQAGLYYANTSFTLLPA